jgi:hypothetical protein
MKPRYRRTSCFDAFEEVGTAAYPRTSDTVTAWPQHWQTDSCLILYYLSVNFPSNSIRSLCS